MNELCEYLPHKLTRTLNVCVTSLFRQFIIVYSSLIPSVRELVARAATLAHHTYTYNSLAPG